MSQVALYRTSAEVRIVDLIGERQVSEFRLNAHEHVLQAKGWACVHHQNMRRRKKANTQFIWGGRVSYIVSGRGDEPSLTLSVALVRPASTARRYNSGSRSRYASNGVSA